MSLEGRHIKALRKKAKRGFNGYPVATVAFYGPTDMLAAKVAVGILPAEGEDVIDLRRWVSTTQDIRRDHTAFAEIVDYIHGYGVHTVAITERIIGCPHEEGIDYPEGQVCPNCVFWANRDRWSGEVRH